MLKGKSWNCLIFIYSLILEKVSDYEKKNKKLVKKFVKNNERLKFVVKECKQLIQFMKNDNIDSDSESEQVLPNAQKMIESDYDIFSDWITINLNTSYTNFLLPPLIQSMDSDNQVSYPLWEVVHFSNRMMMM